MWLTRLAITRPVTILMMVLTLVIMGLQSRSRLPVDLYPTVDFPMVFISTTYAGTGPEEMETLITKPIEDQISTISGLKQLTSTSAEGVSQVQMEFEIGTNIDVVSSDVRSKLDALRRQLPQDADAPVVTKLDIGATPVIQINIASKTRSSIEVRRLADDLLKDRLSQVSGVGTVTVQGGDIREIQVRVDKNRLEAYNIGISQVASALQAEDINLPAGNIQEKTRDYAIRMMGEFTSPEQILNVRIANTAGNPDLTIRDVARVVDTVAKPDSYTRVNGGASVALTVQKQSDGNTVKVVEGIKQMLEEMTGKPYINKTVKVNPAAVVIPPDVLITTSADQSIFINQSLDDVYVSLLLGALLAVFIVFLFLHSIRGTIIVGLAIPTSMISTFIVMGWLNFSVNMMTMLALSLSVGILVDDSIVVIENIHRHLKMGKSPRDAAIAGRTEIGLAAMTISMVDVVVFLPIAFMGGIVGSFMRQFGIVVASATLCSLFISFTLTPMLASRWLKSHDVEEAEEERQRTHPGLFRRFTDAWEYRYAQLEALYRRVLAWSLDHHAAVICLGLMVFVASMSGAVDKSNMTDPATIKTLLTIVFILCVLATLGMLIARRRGAAAHISSPAKPLLITLGLLVLFVFFAPTKFTFEFAPSVDQRQFSIKVEEPVGTTLDVTDAVSKRIDADLRDPRLFPEMKTVSTFVGGSPSGGMSLGSSSADTAQFSGELKDMQPGFRTTDEVIKVIILRYAGLPGAKVTASMPSGNGPGGTPVDIVVNGQDMNRIEEVAGQIEDIVKAIPGTYATELSWRQGRPEVQAHIDRDRAAQYGLSVSQIASALRTSIEGDINSKYRDNGKEYDIRVSLPEDQRVTIDQLSMMVVGTTASGDPVHLQDVVMPDQAAGPTKIERTDRLRSVAVTGNLAKGTTIGNVQQLIDAKIAQLDTRGVSVKWYGSAQMMTESFGIMKGAMLLSVILVFILMAALFESLISPLIIWLAVPQAMAGALIALTVLHLSFSIMSMIGIIMLVGLVTKNSILMVDYTNTLRREHGLDRRAALQQAGPTRLRPILMTTLAMIFGMLPTAVALSKGSEMRQPMAVAVIGGLLLSLFLSLLMVPTFYEIIDGFGEWFGRKKQAAISEMGL